MPQVSYPRRLRELAAADPHRPAVSCGTATLSRAELQVAATRCATALRARGVQQGDMVTIALPNSVEWVATLVACWQLGAIPQPVSSILPPRELEAIVEMASSKVVVARLANPSSDERYMDFPDVGSSDVDHDDALPDLVSPAWKAPTSGGSTGRPKLIVSGDPALFDEEGELAAFFPRDSTVVVPGPLYHNGPLTYTALPLLCGNHVVLFPRFDPEATLSAVEQHRAFMLYLVPTMMKRIWQLPLETRTGYDLSSLQVVWHMAEPCPTWLKQAWIDWLGPERILELYGGTEGQLTTVISGTEWLLHPGSVGLPVSGKVKITEEDGKQLPPGEVGEVWLHSGKEAPTYHYIGASPRTQPGGWESLGDMGWVDEDGYLYLEDRKQDMILVGGANIYPAEVEGALLEHPQVRSCAVIGLPDEDRGNRVHAIIEADSSTLTEDELRSFLADRLVRTKHPRTIEFVTTPLRDEAGKVRRIQLRAERLRDADPSVEEAPATATAAAGASASTPAGSAR